MQRLNLSVRAPDNLRISLGQAGDGLASGYQSDAGFNFFSAHRIGAEEVAVQPK